MIAMKNIRSFVFMVNVVLLVGCTPLDVANSLATLNLPDEGHIDSAELHWDPQTMYDTSCPDVSGSYLIPSNTSQEVNIPIAISDVKKKRESKFITSKDRLNIVVTLKPQRSGLLVLSQSSEAKGEYALNFSSDKFGCANGEYIRRFRPHYSGGNESGKCLSVYYKETHWKKTASGDLQERTTYRERCWVQRGDNLPQSDVVSPPLIFKHIADIDQAF